MEAQSLRRKEELISNNKEEVGRQRELQFKKEKAERELNKYKKIWSKYIEMKNNSKYLKEFIETPLQADEFMSEEEPLRK